MPADAELFLLFGVLHLIALFFAAMLFLLVLRTDTATQSSPPGEGEDDGGGGSPPRPHEPSGPRPGGVPLPDARPARVRLREPVRLADVLPAPARRPVRDPQRVPERI